MTARLLTIAFISCNFYSIIFFITEVLLPPWVSQSLYDVLMEKQDLMAFSKLVQKSSFQSLLIDPLTILAPNNAAMAMAGNVASSSNVTLIDEFVFRHVLAGNLYTTVLGSSVMSLGNETLKVKTNGTDIFIGGAKIVQSDILASNGVIQVIDHVLP